MSGELNELGYVPEDGWRAVRRYRCEGCLETVAENALLKAPNPFTSNSPDNVIFGCPDCFEVENFSLLCDFPDCTHAVSSGEPTPEGGYIHRCHEHSLWAFRKRAASVDTHPKDGDPSGAPLVSGAVGAEGDETPNV